MFSFLTPPSTLRSDVYKRGWQGDTGSSGAWTEIREGEGGGDCPESHRARPVSSGSHPNSWDPGHLSLLAPPAPLPTSAPGRCRHREQKARVEGGAGLRGLRSSEGRFRGSAEERHTFPRAITISACQVVVRQGVRARREEGEGARSHKVCAAVRRGRARPAGRAAGGRPGREDPGRRSLAGGGGGGDCGDAPRPAEPVRPRWVRWLGERCCGHGHPGQSERSSTVSRRACFLSWGGGHGAHDPGTSPGGWHGAISYRKLRARGAEGGGLPGSRVSPGRRARGTDAPGWPSASRPTGWGGCPVVRTRALS